jgi:hypothetical protein
MVRIKGTDNLKTPVFVWRIAVVAIRGGVAVEMAAVVENRALHVACLHRAAANMVTPAGKCPKF